MKLVSLNGRQGRDMLYTYSDSAESIGPDGGVDLEISRWSKGGFWEA